MTKAPKDIQWRVEWLKAGFGWLLAASFTLPHDSTPNDACAYCRKKVPFYEAKALRASRTRVHISSR